MRNDVTKKLLYQEKLLSLYEYYTEESPTYEIPILLVPPLMVPSCILDLTYSLSFARTLAQKGFKVYLVDFMNPDSSNANVGLETYILDMLYRAVFMVKKHTKSEKVSLIGFGLGGTFSIAYACASIDIKNDIQNVISIAGAVDFRLVKLPKFLLFSKKWFLQSLISLYGYLPGWVLRAYINFSAPFSFILRPLRLLFSSKDKYVIERYNAVGKLYNSINNLPMKTFEQMTKVFDENKLVSGTLKLMDVNFDFSNFKANLFTVAGNKDKYIPTEAVSNIHKYINVPDSKHLDVDLGHISIMTSLESKHVLWNEICVWLSARSGSTIENKSLVSTVK